MKAMIFAAGYGKRLLPITQETPKALIKVQNRPALDWVIESLIRCGVTDVLINTHHLHLTIQQYIHHRQYPIPIQLSYEPTILGTGGGLYNTRAFWNHSDFFVCNADILCTAKLSDMLAHHRFFKPLVTLAINNQISNSMLLVDERGYVVGSLRNGVKTRLCNAKGKVTAFGFCGFQVISPQLFSLMTPPISFSIIDEYYKLLQSGVQISTWHIGNSYWTDIGTHEDLETANRQFPGLS